MSSFPSSHHLVFSYGSNSLSQLRARVLSLGLLVHPSLRLCLDTHASSPALRRDGAEHVPPSIP